MDRSEPYVETIRRAYPDLAIGSVELNEQGQNSVVLAVDGAWIQVRIPFAEMQASFRGYRPRNAPAIDPARIRSLGLSIGDKQAGPFRLEIDWIRGYRN